MHCQHVSTSEKLSWHPKKAEHHAPLPLQFSYSCK